MAIYRNQTGTIDIAAGNKFYEDVIKGLRSDPKCLSSKYFYDKEGDRLFQEIMASPEYYLTNCEMEIFSQQTEAIAAVLLKQFSDFDIVELGAGDATKSSHLLNYLRKLGVDITYYPVDISRNVIHHLETEMPSRIPGLKVHGLNGDYFDMISRSYKVSDKRKVILFLGSSIGNFTPEKATHFLDTVHEHLLPGDVLLTGFDLKKDPRQILAAYNDAGGITKRFNLNLLTRINRELHADFDIKTFGHYPVYDPVTGACRSYLRSHIKQEVIINGRDLISFKENESIYMELSQKYTVADTDTMAGATGFTPIHYFFDSRHWFLDAIWERE